MREVVSLILMRLIVRGSRLVGRRLRPQDLRLPLSVQHRRRATDDECERMFHFVGPIGPVGGYGDGPL